jgi:hypothetical protein
MIEDLIRRARRRLIVNEALSQSALAGAFLVGGLALILILGTKYLEWWTLAIFALAGIAFGGYRIRRAIPGEYAAAVRVDQNAELKDSLSTALWFSHHEAPFPEARAIQFAQAEAAARSVNLDTAIPFTLPRSIYVMAGLALLATGLVAFRFASTRGLDLHAPLTEILFEDLAANPKDKKPNFDDAKRQRMDAAESLLAKLGVPLNPEDKKDEAALDRAIDKALEGAQSPGDKGQKGADGKSEEGKSGLEPAPNGDPLDGKEAKDPNAEKNQGKDGGAGDNKGAPKDSNGENNSLMSKLKDAVNNIFSKPGNEKADKKDGQQQASKSDQKSGEKGQNGQGKDQNGQNQDAKDGEPSGDSQQDGQQAQGKAGSKSAQQSAQAGSGAGSQDGAKDLKAAEQLKAMGKISEIIGKRSATVTGETTIEVESGNQSLRTNYSNKAAAHGEADSDVSRDEIPVAMQPYVQSYFEQVRKSAQPAKPKAAPSAPEK